MMMRECGDWTVVEVGARTYIVEVDEGRVRFAPCQIVSFCGAEAVQYAVDDVQVIDILPDVHLYFMPLDEHVNDLKALLLGHLTN